MKSEGGFSRSGRLLWRNKFDDEGRQRWFSVDRLVFDVGDLEGNVVGGGNGWGFMGWADKNGEGNRAGRRGKVQGSWHLMTHHVWKEVGPSNHLRPTSAFGARPKRLAEHRHRRPQAMGSGSCVDQARGIAPASKLILKGRQQAPTLLCTARVHYDPRRASTCQFLFYVFGLPAPDISLGASMWKTLPALATLCLRSFTSSCPSPEELAGPGALGPASSGSVSTPPAPGMPTTPDHAGFGVANSMSFGSSPSLEPLAQ